MRIKKNKNTKIYLYYQAILISKNKNQIQNFIVQNFLFSKKRSRGRLYGETHNLPHMKTHVLINFFIHKIIKKKNRRGEKIILL